MSVHIVADMLMGFYLFAIAIQDLQYREVYHKYSHEWTSSLGCTFVGVVAMTSTEVTTGTLPVSISSYIFLLLPKTDSISEPDFDSLTGFPVAFSLYVYGTLLVHSFAVRLHKTQPEDGQN